MLEIFPLKMKIIRFFTIFVTWNVNVCDVEAYLPYKMIYFL